MPYLAYTTLARKIKPLFIYKTLISYESLFFYIQYKNKSVKIYRLIFLIINFNFSKFDSKKQQIDVFNDLFEK